MIATVTQTFDICTEEDMELYLSEMEKIMAMCKLSIFKNINIDYSDRYIEPIIKNTKI